MYCRHCKRELAGPFHKESDDLFCVMCMEEVQRVAEALLYRDDMTIQQFFIHALDWFDLAGFGFVGPISDERLITHMSDLTEEKKGHQIPCEICISKRKGKE